MKFSTLVISVVITLAAAFTSPKLSVSNQSHATPNTSAPTTLKNIDEISPSCPNTIDHIHSQSDENSVSWLINDILLKSSTTSLQSNRNANEFTHSDLNERKREFEMNLGKAIDTLRKDYPDMLTRLPDFTIYDRDIEVVDPSGVTLHSLQSYKTSFQFLHMVIKVFYCPEQSGLTFRLVYDCARKSVRVSWNAYLVPRAIYGGTRNKLHVDGISVYEVDQASGLISQHRVEHLLVNDAPVTAPQGIFHALAVEANENPEGIPVWNVNQVSLSNDLDFMSSSPTSDTLRSCNKSHRSKSKGFNWNRTNSRPPSMLFSSSSGQSSPYSSAEDHPLFDQKAYESKNQSRKKFGLQPITPDEFIQIQIETKELEVKQQQKAAEIASSSAAEMTNKKESFANKLFNFAKNTCEDNWDCQRPEVCCDFGFKKMCCRSGQAVFGGLPNQKLTKIPIRVVAGQPKGGPGSDGMNY